MDDFEFDFNIDAGEKEITFPSHDNTTTNNGSGGSGTKTIQFDRNRQEQQTDSDIGLDLIINKTKTREAMLNRENNTPQQKTPPFTFDTAQAVKDTKTDAKPADDFFNIDDLDIEKDIGGGDISSGNQSTSTFKMTEPSFPMKSMIPPTNNYYNQSSIAEPMTHKELQMRKTEILQKIERLRKKGPYFYKSFSMSNDYDEMQSAYDTAYREHRLRIFLKERRREMVSFGTLVENANNKAKDWVGMGLELDGFSGVLSDDIDEYDDIFERLYDKYEGSEALPPELELVYKLGKGIMFYHVNNTKLKNELPHLQDTLDRNPELKRQLIEANIREMPDKKYANYVAQEFNGRFAEKQHLPQIPQFKPSNQMMTTQSNAGNSLDNDIDDMINNLN